MKYLVKTYNWKKDESIYIIVNNNQEFIDVISKSNEDSVINITPLNGTIYMAQDYLKDK